MRRNIESISLAALVAILVACGGCASGDGKSEGRPANAPEQGMVGSVVLHEPPPVQGNKVILASFAFTATGVTVVDTLVAFGSGGVPRSEANHYRIALIVGSGNKAFEYGIFNPRRQVVEKEGLVEVPRAEYVSRFPFRADATAVQVADSNGNIVATADVRAAIGRFCAEQQNDPDCRAVKY